MRIALCFIVFLSMFSLCFGIDPTWVITNEVTVPTTEYPTIQDAVDGCHAAGGGWLIKVLGNQTYDKVTINAAVPGEEWSNKLIVLQGILKRGELPVIDADQSGPCIFAYGCALEVDGFKLMNGSGYLWTYNGQKHYYGGAIAAQPHWTSTVIENCTIWDNSIQYDADAASASGGGIFIGNFQGNTPPTNGYKVRIQGCNFQNNGVCDYNGYPDSNFNSAGGALFCRALKEDSSIKDNYFKDNVAHDYGGAIFLAECHSMVIDANEFYSNKVQSFSGVDDNASTLQMKEFQTDSEVVITNNFFCQNGATPGTGSSNMETVLIQDVYSTCLANNTIASNHANNSYAVVIKMVDINQDCLAQIWNNIICFNDCHNSYQMGLFGQNENDLLSFELGYNCFHLTDEAHFYTSNYVDLITVTGNASQMDPDFQNSSQANFHLAYNSYCDDSGVSPNPAYPPYNSYAVDANIPSYDFDRDRRPLDSKDLDTDPEWDIGADEYVFVQ